MVSIGVTFLLEFYIQSLFVANVVNFFDIRAHVHIFIVRTLYIVLMYIMMNENKVKSISLTQLEGILTLLMRIKPY